MTPPNATGLPLRPEDRTIPRMLLTAAERHGEHDLFSCLGETWRYADAPHIAARMAGALKSAGMKAGDRIAILSPNRPELMRLLLGCGWLGAIAVPLNTAVKTRQLRYYLENSGARLLVIDAGLAAALDTGALAGLPLESVWYLDEPRRADLGVRAQASLTDGPLVPAHPSRPRDPFAILYTSGTTGAPKGVICPHAQFHWWAVASARFLELREGDRLVTTLPLFHTNALNAFFQALLTGSTQVVLPRFSASRYWEQMCETNATVGYLLGAMVPMLLAQPPNPAERNHRLRVVLGPGVPAQMHDQLYDRAGVRLVDGYGSTETNFVIGTSTAERVPGRMGFPAPGIAVRVVDNDDVPVPPGMAGELILRADEPECFASGYHGMHEKTVEAWRNLWFHSGDRVIQYEDGSLSFVDRLKDAIRRRGENISSFEVEQVLSAHRAVDTVAVYPVPSDLAEDEVMAAIVLKSGETLDAAEFFDYCVRELPRHAVPRYIDVRDDLPRTENGKIQKFRLREEGVTSRTLDRAKLTGR